MARKLQAVANQLVDTETGEITERACPHCMENIDQLAGAEKEIRAWRSRYEKLKRDRAHEAETNQFWPLAEALFLEWRIATGHIRSHFTHDRFWMCQPYLEREGYATCRYAVWGVAVHPNRKQITPGYFEVYDQWELVFDRNQGTFERYANRGAAVVGREFPIPAAMEVPEWLNVPIYARERIRAGIYPEGNEGTGGEDLPAGS